MKDCYGKYKTEIWGGIAIFVAIIVPIILDNNSVEVFFKINFVPYIIYIACLAMVSIVFIVNKKSVKIEGLYYSNLKKTFKDVIDKASTQYWHYGMSGEELQREVNLNNYLLTTNELPEMKIILLHPDCNSFKERINNRNKGKGRDIDALISRKRNLILSLLDTIKALPEEKKNKIEVRFTQTYPIWILQFIVTRTAKTNEVNQLFLKIHPNNKHSKCSKLYEANVNTDIFNSFKNYFLREWDAAMKIDNYKIPNLIN